MMWMFEILRAFLSLFADTNFIKSSGEYRNTFLVLNGSKCFVNSSVVKKPLENYTSMTKLSWGRKK